MGMMPSDEIEIEHNYKDSSGLSVDISSGPHGWTILWADGAATFKDVDDTSENNFTAAYNFATSTVGELIPTKVDIAEEK